MDSVCAAWTWDDIGMQAEIRVTFSMQRNIFRRILLTFISKKRQIFKIFLDPDNIFLESVFLTSFCSNVEKRVFHYSKIVVSKVVLNVPDDRNSDILQKEWRKMVTYALPSSGVPNFPKKCNFFTLHSHYL